MAGILGNPRARGLILRWTLAGSPTAGDRRAMETIKKVIANEWVTGSMETLKKVVTNEYFPAAAVLSGVILFWVLGLFGGLSLLSTRQSPVTTLTWMIFVYAAAVLSPLAGLVAAIDLVRRWLRNRQAATAESAVRPPRLVSRPAPCRCRRRLLTEARLLLEARRYPCRAGRFPRRRWSSRSRWLARHRSRRNRSRRPPRGPGVP